MCVLVYDVFINLISHLRIAGCACSRQECNFPVINWKRVCTEQQRRPSASDDSVLSQWQHTWWVCHYQLAGRIVGGPLSGAVDTQTKPHCARMTPSRVLTRKTRAAGNTKALSRLCSRVTDLQPPLIGIRPEFFQSYIESYQRAASGQVSITRSLIREAPPICMLCTNGALGKHIYFRAYNYE